MTFGANWAGSRCHPARLALPSTSRVERPFTRNNAGRLTSQELLPLVVLPPVVAFRGAQTTAPKAARTGTSAVRGSGRSTRFGRTLACCCGDLRGPTFLLR